MITSNNKKVAITAANQTGTDKITVSTNAAI